MTTSKEQFKLVLLRAIWAAQNDGFFHYAHALRTLYFKEFKSYAP